MTTNGDAASVRLALSEYARAGTAMVRQLVTGPELDVLLEAWKHFANETLRDHRQVDPFNAVVVHETVPETLALVYRLPALLDLMVNIYSDLALYTQRFVVKDQRSRGPVFLHQDFGYDHGWPEKTSLFLALSPVNLDNGGLILYPGTHAYGYLGDVGEIDPGAFASDTVRLKPDTTISRCDWAPICPTLEPGDAVLMHECLWHGSHPHTSGPDRVLVQVTYQPASDPTGKALLRGSWKTDLRVGEQQRERVFKRSRSSRLRELQSLVNQQKNAT